MIVLLNNSAGGGGRDQLFSEVRAAFSKLGAAAQVEVATTGEQLCELARAAAKDLHDPIVAAGGDGTISAVASALVGSGKTLGVLPLGTLNHFAKDLGVPLALEAAVATVVHGETREIDVGEVNGHYFINNSSIGLYPEIVRRRDKERELFNRGKWPAMAKAFLASLREYRFLRVRVRTEGREFSRTTPFVFVGNNTYDIDRFGIGGRPDLSTGTLCFWLARGTRPLGILRLGLRALLGILRGARDFEALCGREFWVNTAYPRQRVALDGETRLMDAPLHYRSRPRALRVIGPAKEVKS
jgi:diacylglycerol kinase family enzyme